jgi:DNA-directed RNA polymerase subunit K/omega
LKKDQEIEALASVYRDDTNAIVDDNHKSLPILTKYERTRIIGQRAKQINQGARPFVVVPEGVIDGYIIAEMELKEKKIPFIIQRPMPNGSKEFWKVEDLEQVDF